MEKKKLESIYYMTCNDEIINDKTLKKRGLTEKDIKYLLDEDRIYAYNDHEYVISYMGDLLDFAKEKIQEHLYVISDKAIDICYEMSHDDFEVLTMMFEKQFIKDKKKNKYDQSINYLRRMEKVADTDEIKDVNCYIFLLSMLTELPDDLRLAAKYFKLHDLTLNGQDNRFYSVEERNMIRKNIFYQKFSNALRDSKKIPDKEISTFAYDVTIIKLAEEVTTRRKKQSAVITDLATNDREDEILLFYEEEKKRRVLTKHEEYIEKLAKSLSNIRQTGIIPIRNYCPNGKFYDMIDNNDFKTALDRVIEMHGKNPLPLSSSSSYVLLTKIIQETNNIREKEIVKQKI